MCLSLNPKKYKTPSKPIDEIDCLASYPGLAISVSAVRYEQYVKVDTNRLPRCTYMDDTNYIHYIDEHDGLDNDE
jgi:hypothetical protein